MLGVAGLSYTNDADNKVVQLQVEGGEVLHTLQGQVGHAADKSLLLGQILFLGGLFLWPVCLSKVERGLDMSTFLSLFSLTMALSSPFLSSSSEELKDSSS